MSPGARKGAAGAAQREDVGEAEVVREYGPFDGAPVHGVSFDGERVWAATGARLVAFDPASGEPVRTLEVACDAGTAFDGRHLYQLAGDRILRVDPTTGAVLGSIPAPEGAGGSGLCWAEGSLWLGRYGERRILRLDPATGAVLRTIESDRFVTGVTWVDGELWHGTMEAGESELRRVDPDGGAVRARLAMPRGVLVSGLESDGAGLFFCGGAASGKVRAVRRPGPAGRTASRARRAGPRGPRRR
ncbi:Vgb family protein [Anaeromyxobacter dehalogenans]|uniref:Glutamine cyclotransferase n=1 Tax=Anaeromyxobacter dehalogenans (strain 2CP-C) TaxID=290397 RepID=Q2IMU2_ANADE|nr:hypothetical protein [Anaeromyxobacter dehalogenans]ABC80120.1 conserved hypothetical protein [Anaeromyxobacter dehalogenans 2CP-C]